MQAPPCGTGVFVGVAVSVAVAVAVEVTVAVAVLVGVDVAVWQTGLQLKPTSQRTNVSPGAHSLSSGVPQLPSPQNNSHSASHSSVRSHLSRPRSAR